MRRVLMLLSACLVMSLLFAPAAVAQNGTVEGCDPQTLTANQYDECTASIEEITGFPAGTTITSSNAVFSQGPAASELPDTGGPALLPIAGIAVMMMGVGGLLLKRRLS